MTDRYHYQSRCDPKADMSVNLNAASAGQKYDSHCESTIVNGVPHERSNDVICANPARSTSISRTQDNKGLKLHTVRIRCVVGASNKQVVP